MSIWPRPPCLRQKSLPFLSSSGPHLPRRAFWAPQRRSFFPGGVLRARFATTRCHKYFQGYDDEMYADEVEDEDEDGIGMNLGAEILEFMRNSSKPEAFPSRMWRSGSPALVGGQKS